MRFGNPYFLLGSVTVAVPLLIFLLTRDRVRKVAFSTLRFFAGAASTLLKRKRWHEMLLLAMRMAISPLLALAFARPLLKNRDAGEGQPIAADHAVAVVVDVSASMGRRPGVPGARAFEQARNVVGKALDELPGDTAVTLIAFDSLPRIEAGLDAERGELREKIAASRRAPAAPTLPPPSARPTSPSNKSSPVTSRYSSSPISSGPVGRASRGTTDCIPGSSWTSGR